MRRRTSGDGRGREGGDEGTLRGGSKRNIFNSDEDIRDDKSGADDDAKDWTTATTTTDECFADFDEDRRYRCGDER